MLACIDELTAGRILKRTGTPAQAASGLQQGDREPAGRQACGGCQARKATTDNHHLLSHPLPLTPNRVGTACTTRLSLRQRLKLTRLLKTS